MAGYQYTSKDLERFWSKVNKEGAVHPYNSELGKCWEWTRSCGSHGYGNFSYKQVYKLAHRASWEIEYGNIPSGMEICHSCDNHSCVNPIHLFIGTHQDNMDDMNAKERGNHHHDNRARGERHGCHKLSLEQVTYIRERYAKGDISQSQLARDFKVVPSTIWWIVRNSTWK